MADHVQLTRITIRRFKRLDEAEFDLGPVTILCGPNNFGKTSGLQALSLWHAGLRQWLSKRSSVGTPDKRPGVAINRLELTALPVSSTRQLWWREQVRNSQRSDDGKQATENLRIEIVVDGSTNGEAWQCGLEFDYPNDESIYCRPIRLNPGKDSRRMPVPDGAATVRVAMLPPMSGLAATEPKWMEGRIDALIGEGRTAEVLRNLCHRLFLDSPAGWADLAAMIRQTFHVEIQPPRLVEARGELTMEYMDISAGCRLDITAAGRGQQQLMLLLAYMLSNPGTVLLFDEPDAHLEILRQRQTYSLLSDLASRQGCQIIAASHSEIVLSEAAQKDTVIAFVGRPHPLTRTPSQLMRWLKDYPVDHLYQAEITKAVLYLEGATDLAILQEFARKLDHPAQEVLACPFVFYVGGNDPSAARKHFNALREAFSDIRGIALFDWINLGIDETRGNQPPILVWRRREIENYFCSRPVLMRWAAGPEGNDLFGLVESRHRLDAMKMAVAAEEEYARGIDLDIWSADAKASDDVLDKIMRRFHKTLGTYNEMGKSRFHLLARYLATEEMDEEIGEKLDKINDILRPLAADEAGV